MGVEKALVDKSWEIRLLGAWAAFRRWGAQVTENDGSDDPCL